MRAIQAVSTGGSAFDPRSAAVVLRTVSGGEAETTETLSDREREVLRLLADGMSNKRIGGETLYISESTVKFHIRNIIRKLGGVTKRTDAVYTASKRGLI